MTSGMTRPAAARERGPRYRDAGVAFLALVCLTVPVLSGCTSDPAGGASATSSGSGGQSSAASNSGSAAPAPGGEPLDYDPSDPSSVAAAFATAASRGDLSGVPFTSDTAAAATPAAKAIFAAFGSTHPTVTTATKPQSAGDTQQTTATLRYQWQLAQGAPAWTYDTPLTLVKDDQGRWNVSWAPSSLVNGLTKGATLAVRALPAPRGRILGAKKAVIVTDRPVLRVGIDRTQVSAAKLTASATKVASAVGIDPKEYVAAVTGAGPSAFVVAITYRADDPAADKALRAIGTTPGARSVTGTAALAPTRTFARPLLGIVGPATAEIVQQSGGAVKATDEVGLGGLQQAQDAVLRGTPGIQVTSSATPAPLYSYPGTRGKDITTTLDVGLQSSAESLLAKVTPASAIVAIRPSTGEVLAAASGPGGQGYSTATLGQYAPGSTFKVVSGLAIMRSGVTPTTTVQCPATITVDGRTFKNYDAYPASKLGSVPFLTAFANSCNTAMIDQAGKVSQQALNDAADALGLQASPAVGVSAYLGNVPTKAAGTEHAASMIGQGQVLASPLGMATVAASVVKGSAVRPHLLASGPTSAIPAPAHPLTGSEAASLRAMMRAVVTEGSGHLLAGLPGQAMAKTGTAEYGNGSPPATHAWMIAARGDLAVAVFVETGAGGAKTAGPILASFLKAAPVKAGS